MNAINALLPFIPMLVMMGALWINCHCLDALPKHAFAETRHHVRWAAVFLLMIIIQVATAVYMTVATIQEKHQSTQDYRK